jgi:hypothetical protein
MIPPDQPPATLIYLGLYVLTLVLHVLSMNYVLAGQTYLAVVSALEAVRGPLPSQQAPAAKLRDWLPFALGVTITAGVAPLLFVQILYKRPFYTANLLLFHRWMAILPVLIAAFYLLYLQKSGRRHTWSLPVRALISIGIWGCFTFVAWSWTENHLLSLRNQAGWTAEYAANRWFASDVEHLPRLLVWYFGAFSVMATALGWQLRHEQMRRAHAPPTEGPPELAASAVGGDAATPAEIERRSARTVRVLALTVTVSLIAALAAAGFYHQVLHPEIAAKFATNGLPYAALAAVGIAIQTESWRRMLTRGAWSAGALTAATIGVVLAITGGTILREVRRTASVSLATFAAAHAKAGQVGGLGLFLLFFIANTIAIYAAVRLVRRGLRSAK